MKITTVSVTYSRKFNLGNYESLELGCSLWAQVEDGEDADGVTEFLYHQAKESVKIAAMPVLKTSEFQMSKAKSNDPESAASKKTQTQNNNQQYKVQPTRQTVTSPSIDPKDLRVKEIRILLDYPIDLVKNWLHSHNVNSPSELDSTKIDQLVNNMCLAWAADKFDHPNHAANSYQKHVVDAVLRGISEISAIQVWMEGTLAQMPELSVHY